MESIIEAGPTKNNTIGITNSREEFTILQFSRKSGSFPLFFYEKNVHIFRFELFPDLPYHLETLSSAAHGALTCVRNSNAALGIQI